MSSRSDRHGAPASGERQARRAAEPARADAGAQLDALRLLVTGLENRLAEASADARRLAATLADLTAALAGGPPGEAGSPGSVAASVVQVPSGSERPGAGRVSTRAPLALPPAVLEDSADAAAHLIRAPGALMVVDGYNVSFCGWPEAGIADQRERLVNALSELAARCTSAVQVVFDGAEDEELPPQRGAARRAVKVVFSPPGVDADEVIIDLVASLPVHRPVLVATSDRRLQHEVRRRGANVLSSPQTLALLGRGAERRP
ncbi:MAG TPA: NYN domain-containing protein [Acidimicrobiales bacterium]|nr:NYN domain-containing protein [Acidimicrobiales bacterium]